MQHVFLHVDLDAFFASVEQLDHPEWKGLPVIVGGKPGDRRSVVSTASYEARKYGVHSAMPTFQAVKLCPNGIFVHGRHERYEEKSAEVMEIFSEFSPDVIQISVDEAFIDLTGTERLFGDPEQTARRIKDEVKRRTGLTVSVGMAATKYIAKIASGLHKPDGFLVVPPGKETEFMMSLPLEKVWGVGSKTLDHLRASGFHTTADIYARSEQLLISIFGSATGSFLYNAVRGNEVETFTNDAKSHSLSGENTFEYDLTDRDVIDTALLELSQTVMFRLLREKLRSHCVALKIRYEDFTTVSIQDSSGHDVSSLDDLYERAKILFSKKYESGRGIRLLGLGVQNVESSDAPHQANLFDFGEEKKQKVEKAILAAEEKDPAVKIKKARLLNKELLILFSCCALLFLEIDKTAYAEEKTTESSASGAGSIVFDTSNLPPLGTNTTSLFNYDIGDKNVEFRAEGYWQSTVTNTSSYSFGFGSTAGYSTGTPVFVQNVDLSLWFLLDHHWYFESSFADGFDKNTVALGYYGDGILKEARIANRGIVFPSTYSVDAVNRGIGGGDNQAPGISLCFSDDTWRADAVLRYDMLESQEKTWYGKNAVSTETTSLSSYMTGRQYILPSYDTTAAVSGVYVESSSGSYKDTQGRTYKKLDTTEYLVLPARCEVVLSSDADAETASGIVPAVAFVFDSTVTESSLKSELGTYGTSSSLNTTFSGSGFLGDVQKWFGSLSDSTSSVSIPNVSSFSYGKSNGSAGPGPDKTGTETDGFFTTINNQTVLLVQHPAGFSPFIAAYRYDGGTTAASDALVKSSSTETSSSVYLAVIADDETTFVSDDFFSSKHTYADVYYKEAETSSSSSAVSPKVRFPLAGTDPGIYLGTERTNDLVLSLRSYTAVSRFDIGTKAVAGTVRVYKNGVIDSGAVYDEEAGTITLSSAVSSGDHIYATWYEDSGSSDSGAIAAAAGFSKQFTKDVSGDISFSMRWSYAADKTFADSSYSSPGFFTIASGISKKTDSLTLSNVSAATIESDNTTGYYRVLGMDDSESSTVYLTQSAAVSLPSGFVPAINARPGSSDTEPSLESSFNCSVDAQSGKNDSSISGYAVPVSWNFSAVSENSSVSTTNPAWAATALNLPGNSSVASASTFSIALKNSEDISGNSLSDSDISVYLQLGVEADDDFKVEDTSSVPTWLISKCSSVSSDAADLATNPADVQKSFIADAAPSATENKDGWQTVTVVLSAEDRARLSAHYDARLIICSSNPSSSSITEGTIYAGPYETGNLTFSSYANSAITISQEQTHTNAPSNTDTKRFNSSTNYYEHTEWTTDENSFSSLTSSDTFDVTLTRYFSEADMTPYKSVSFWFNYAPVSSSKETYSGNAQIINDANTVMTILLDRPQSDGTTKKAVRLSFYKTALSVLNDGSWHCISIDLTDDTVTVGGTSLSKGTDYTLSTDNDIVPTRFQATFTTADPSSSSVYTQGSFSLDELYFSDTSPHFILQDTAAASWKKDGAVVQCGDNVIVKDVSFKTTGTGSSTIYTSGSDDPDGSLTGSIGGGATIPLFKISADAARTSSSSLPLTNAGHSISTDTPLFNMISASEEYRFDHTSETLEKNNSASVSFSPLHIPLSLSASAAAESTSWAQTQSSSAKASFAAGPFAADVSASVKQKLLPSSDDVEECDTDNYVNGWKDSTSLAFSTGSSAASWRALSSSANASYAAPFFSLKPSAAFSTSGTYTDSTSTLFTDNTSCLFTLPFAAGKNAFSLSWKKEGGGTATSTAGGSYYRDGDDLVSSLKNKTWYFSSLPFYDFVSSKLSDDVLADTTMTTDSSDSLYYTGTYSASWKRSFTGTRYDFYLPSSATLSASRDIRTSATISDIYQIKGLLGWTALNVLCRTGTIPLFSWFQQDAYTSSFSAVLKIPRSDPSSVTSKYTGYIQSDFYINDTDVLKTGIECSFETTDDWSGKGTLVWKRRGKMSPILGAIQIFKPDFTYAKTVITRTDSFNAEVSETESSTTTNSEVIKKQSFALTHLVELALTKYVTVNGSVTGSYACTWDSVITVSGTASLGCTIKF